MKKRTDRLDAIRMIISRHEICSQDELLQSLSREGYELTQATLSRDLRQMKVARAANQHGKYVYVLPGDIPAIHLDTPAHHSLKTNNGSISLCFSGNLAVLRTRPGYASGMAYDIDNSECKAILGTIAGDDTIMIVLKEGVSHDEAKTFLSQIISGLNG